jgi:hypothetical protein
VGTDINWFIDRRDVEGTWHTVTSKGHATGHVGVSAFDMPAAYLVGTRDYELFARLSGVRGAPMPDGPALRMETPDGLTPVETAERDLYRGDDWCWGDGHRLLGWTDPRLVRWVAGIRSLLAHPLFALPQPVPVHDGPRGWVYDAESAQETSARRRVRFLDPVRDPASWRVVVYYDS